MSCKGWSGPILEQIAGGAENAWWCCGNGVPQLARVALKAYRQLCAFTINKFMRYVELYETRVKSSWIMDLTKDDEENGIIMTLLSGRSYLVNNVPDIVFRRWVRAPSKGKFWHRRIRGNFWVDRLA